MEYRIEEKGVIKGVGIVKLWKVDSKHRKNQPLGVGFMRFHRLFHGEVPPFSWVRKSSFAAVSERCNIILLYTGIIRFISHSEYFINAAGKKRIAKALLPKGGCSL